jgi:hypothetical protein
MDETFDAPVQTLVASSVDLDLRTAVCVVGDGSTVGAETIARTGSRRGSPASPSPLTDPVAVSCASRAACVAVNFNHKTGSPLAPAAAVVP